MDTSVLALVVTAVSFIVTSVSSTASTGAVVVVSAGSAVVGFEFSTACFSSVPWAVVGMSISIFTFLVASVFCTGETVLFVSFSVTAAVKVSSTMIEVVGLAILPTSIFVLTSVRGSLETVSVSLAAAVT